MKNDEDTLHSTFGVAIDPDFKDGKWTGNVSAYMQENLADDLSEEEVFQIRSVCGMMAASLQLMEEEPDFLEYLQTYFTSHFPDMIDDIYEIELEEESKKPSRLFTRSEDGKVITLNFDTKTHGSA